jgi:hypothetical protein
MSAEKPQWRYVTGRGYARVEMPDYPLPDFITEAWFTEVEGGAVITELTVRLNIPQPILERHPVWDPRGWVPQAGPGAEGVTARVLRALTLSPIRADGSAAMPTGDRDVDAALERMFESGGPKGGGRHRKSDLDRALLAAAYVREAHKGAGVFERLRAEMHQSPETLRSYVKQLRVDGFLTRPARRGQPGGELTEKSKELLKGAT